MARMYDCLLINDRGCVFDWVKGTSKKALIEWGKGRGDRYTIYLRRKLTKNEVIAHGYARYAEGTFEHIEVPVSGGTVRMKQMYRWVSDCTGDAY